MATARGRGGGFGRRRSGRHARAAAETAGCRLGRRRSHRRPRTSAAPSTSSPMIGRQFEVSALSGGSVGRLCGSGGRVWSGDRPPVLVCVFSGRLCVLGIRVLSITGNRNLGVSALLRVSRSVCGGVGVFDVPGAGCLRGGSIPPPGVFESGFRGVAGSCCRWRSAGACLLSRAWHRRSACAVRAVFAFWLRRVL